MKLWHMLAVVAISAAWFVAGVRYGSADVRETCPKSGGEKYECKRCDCPYGCPVQCAADAIMQAGGAVTMYADPVAKACGEYGVFARVEANGADDEPRTVAISMKDSACEAFADAARQMKLDAKKCCEK